MVCISDLTGSGSGAKKVNLGEKEEGFLSFFLLSLRANKENALKSQINNII
jgi:hypothetical protein